MANDEVLSQQEIDALIQQMAGGGGPTASHLLELSSKDYNFIKISKPYLRRKIHFPNDIEIKKVILSDGVYYHIDYLNYLST